MDIQKNKISGIKDQATFEIRRKGKTATFIVGGNWSIEYLAKVELELKRVSAGKQVKASDVYVDLANVSNMDTAGAFLIHRSIDEISAPGAPVVYSGSGIHTDLLEEISHYCKKLESEEKTPTSFSLLDKVAWLGALAIKWCKNFLPKINYLGLLVTHLAKLLVKPTSLRLTSFVYHIDHVGLRAVPIVSLLTFLIGVVLAYMGVQQLAKFGAQIFVVDLIEVAVWRELGILLTAIIVAGRSGSSFTAQIGSMIAAEEVDAMQAMGISPIETLVIPRVMALLVAMPLLGILAGAMGMLGGAITSWAVLDITPRLFWERLSSSGNINDFWVGMIKAPFFAVAIGMIACYEGMQVTGSSESVGQMTTKSVVESIFVVIIIDAIFAIAFSFMGI